MSIKEITTGQDSFLDIVANLVGILIILVVMVSAQASTAPKSAKPNKALAEKIDELDKENSHSTDIALKLETDNHQLEVRVVEENRLAANLADQRHEMLIQLEIVRQQMAKQRAENEQKLGLIDTKQREMLQKQNDFELEKRLLEKELEELNRETNAVKASTPKTKVIDHFPNPIAKTVFSEEIHFRLADGVLSYVPMDELIAMMKSEWKVKAEKLKQADRTIETIGPIANYRMQYELVSETVKQNTQFGEVARQSVRFKQFSIQPLAREFGEPVDLALQDGSEFQKKLARLEPRKTTVSIWVYPGSFGGHNKIKSWLHERGFQMASWPLEFGKRISGGPQGFKTSAQ